MIRLNKWRFSAEDDGGGYGAGNVLGDVPQQESNDTTTQETQGEGQQQQQSSSGFNAAEAAKLFAAELKPEFAALKSNQSAAPEKQYTEEELDKLLNRWKPTPEFLAKFSNLETQGAAFNELRDNLIKQALTAAQIIIKRERAELEKTWSERFEPVAKGWQQQTSEAVHTEFNGLYPQLASPKLNGLKAHVADEILKGPNPPTTKEELFKRTAAGVAEVLQTSNPSFVLAASAAGSNNQTKPNGSHKSAPNSRGFGGGGGGQPPAKSAPSQAASVLGGVGR